MRRFINISAFVVFVWLVIDALKLPDELLGFILAGQLPYTNLVVPANVMITFIAFGVLAGALVFLVDKFADQKQIVYLVKAISNKNKHLPKQRFNR